MAKELKEVTEKDLLDAIDDYKKFLFDNPKNSATKCNHYQEALFGVKCLVHDLFGTPRQSEIGWTK